MAGLCGAEGLKAERSEKLEMAQQSENANLDYRSSYHLDCPAVPRALALKATKYVRALCQRGH